MLCVVKSANRATVRVLAQAMSSTASCTVSSTGHLSRLERLKYLRVYFPHIPLLTTARFTIS